MNMKARICHKVVELLLFSPCCRNKLVNYILHRSVEHTGSPRTLWPPSCRDHLLRTPLWRWWGSRMSGRTPAPPAGWRWGHLFLGPQVHLKQRVGGWVNGYTTEKRFTFKRFQMLYFTEEQKHLGRPGSINFTLHLSFTRSSFVLQQRGVALRPQNRSRMPLNPYK